MTHAQKARYWKSQELVMIGVFAAAIKLSTLLIALAGGGMNPISLIIKNLVFTTLLIILLAKVPKSGTLLLFSVVSTIVGSLLLGGNLALFPAAFVASLVAEVIVYCTGGARRAWAPFIAVGIFDFVNKAFSLGMMYLVMRETPALVISFAPVILVGYVGSVIGLYAGFRALKELRHAGIVRA